MEELVIVAERKFKEITEVRKNNLNYDDATYHRLTNDYHVILAAQKKMKANFELVSNRVEHADQEYKLAKLECDNAERVLNRIHKHSML
jgi:hypothetical protein